MKVAYFSSLFGNYDAFVDPPIVEEVDYFLFTDQPIESKIYKVIQVESNLEPVYTARQFKLIKGLLYLRGYDYSIYYDANIVPKIPLLPLIDRMQSDFGIMSHPTRDCIYQEYNACCLAYPPKDDVHRMHKQVQRYLDEGFPEHQGMVSSGVMIRKHTNLVLDFCRVWNKEVQNGSCRDQLSFNYVLYHHELSEVDMFSYQEFLSIYFDYQKHR